MIGRRIFLASACALLLDAGGGAAQEDEPAYARLEGRHSLCVDPGRIRTDTPARQLVANLIAQLEQSPTARDLLRIADRRAIDICVDEHTRFLAYFDSHQQLIGMDPRRREGVQLGALAHELAHIRQHPAYADDRRYGPGDLILLRRLREAAAEAISMRIARELADAGAPLAWQAKIEDGYSDIAHAFEAGLGGGPDAATLAAFDTWFAGQRRLNGYDAMTIGHLERLVRGRGLRLERRWRLDHRRLIGIGAYGQGNFLVGLGRSLTSEFYAGRMSQDLARRLDALVEPGPPAHTDALTN